MNEQMMRERIQQALNAQMSGVRTSPAERSRMLENAIGGTKVKRKLTVGLVFAIILVLMTAAAVATILLTHEEIVEQVAVPLAVGNDSDLSVKQSYSAEELAELVRNLNENGITLKENNAIMQALRTGNGYYEEEAIMEICREAFGGYYRTWTLEQQQWFNNLMVDIGFHENYEDSLPGEDNMTYEQAEAFAFETLKKMYGEDLHPEDRTIYKLERSFGGGWAFGLMPLDVEHGNYRIYFDDDDPAGTVFIKGEIPDWTKPYSADKLMHAFDDVYTCFLGDWPQAAWQKLHEMMLGAEIDPESPSAPEYMGYQLTEYPEPAEDDISRDEAVRIAREAVKENQTAMDFAVLTEYEGKRAWLIKLKWTGENTEDDTNCTVTVDSKTGNVESVKENEYRFDAPIPEAAYEKNGGCKLTAKELLDLAENAVRKKHPDLWNEAEYEIETAICEDIVRITFTTKNVHHGNAYADVFQDGDVLVETDKADLKAWNIFSRYEAMYGWYGGNDDGIFTGWDQGIWAQLAKDIEPMEPDTIEGKLLKLGRYPEEKTVRIGHEEAIRLALKAVGKRTGEVFTCVLIGAEPHPVWKMHVMVYDDNDPGDKVVTLDAETGEILSVTPYATGYAPYYELYSLEKNWRALELEILGPVEIARKEIAYAYGDLSMDVPEPAEFDDPDQYEIQTDGLTVRFIGRWAGMKDYEVELDENGYVLRCEEKDSESTAERPDKSEAFSSENKPAVTPEPLPDGKPWFWGKGIEDMDFWDQAGAIMEKYGVTGRNLDEKVREWLTEYGAPAQMPDDCFILYYLHYLANKDMDFAICKYYPQLGPAGKPSKDVIMEKAREAFHMLADQDKGPEWADSLTICGHMWKDIMVWGELFKQPVWVFLVYGENGDRNGTIVMDEDGNLLLISMRPDTDILFFDD